MLDKELDSVPVMTGAQRIATVCKFIVNNEVWIVTGSETRRVVVFWARIIVSEVHICDVIGYFRVSRWPTKF
jgi:hypothetical protein